MKKKKVFANDGGTRSKKKRIALIGLFFLFGFSALLYRCLYLHLSHDPKLERIAKSQYRTKIAEAPPRGNIYDASENELAVSVPSYSLAARPGKVRDKRALEAKLSSALKMPAKEIGLKLKSEKKYIWVKKFLSPREKDAVEAMEKELNLDGVELVKGSKRYYPNREVASQILGAVGQDNEGLSGIELFYDHDLQGVAEASTAFRDARGRMFETLETLSPASGKDAQEPHHLHLTLHKNIQYAAERELNQTCDKYDAKSCTAIVLDPKTGAVMAMASYPSFNPNNYQSYALGLWRNIAVTDSFEPGSTFKPIMAAAALEKGAVGPDDKFFCEGGNLKIGEYTIHDHEKYGMLSVRQIIKVSSNIGIYKVGKKLGKKAYSEIVEKFGFGKKSGIDYPGEVAGLLRQPKNWMEIDFANISFGQGIRVTPLQLASAYATIANGGVRMKPYIVANVTDTDGNVLQSNGPEEVGRVLSAPTANLIKDIMKGVTEEGGTATRAALPGYTVAGKTGTAQKVVGGRYSHDKYVSSFVGMVPAENPRLVVLVMVDEPKGEIYGGLVAAPVFREIAWTALADLGVPPEKPEEMPAVAKAEAPKKPSKTAASKEKVTGIAEAKEKLGNLAEKTLVQAGLIAAPVFDAAGGAPRSVPDFRGLSKRKVLAILDERKLPCQVVGSGVAQSQVPAPGSVVGKECKIVFRAD
ncbi:MAG TPA: penicillin-binding protein [bacterium]|nr:penicillin-binding protein [bacterium]